MFPLRFRAGLPPPVLNPCQGRLQPRRSARLRSAIILDACRIRPEIRLPASSSACEAHSCVCPPIPALLYYIDADVFLAGYKEGDKIGHKSSEKKKKKDIPHREDGGSDVPAGLIPIETRLTLIAACAVKVK